MASDELPPFGIRGLCSPDESFSVLRISESQYDASINSYPEAALTWLDDDDGEVVTIGTGCELRERLGDPVPTCNPCIKYRSGENQRAEDRYIHLFDISRSHTSLNVWKEHEAYFSKTQILPSDRASQLPESAAVGKDNEEPAAATAAAATQNTEDISTTSLDTKQVLETSVKQGDCMSSADSVSTPVSLPNSIPNLVEGLGFRLDHLAGFLQGTSNTLRKAAEKTRKADTSPIEDVLTGMTTILGEVGAFGLDVIEKLAEPASDSKDTPIGHGKASTINTSNVSDQSSVRSFDSNITQLKCQAFNAKTESSGTNRQYSRQNANEQNLQAAKAARTKLLNDELHLLHRLIALNRRELLQTKDREWTYDAGCAHQTAEIGRSVEREKCLKDMAAIRSELDRFDLAAMKPLSGRAEHLEFHSAASTSSKTKPILDQDADAIDAAFSARYPPLLSLRKAKTFDVLRDTNNGNKHKDETKSEEEGPWVFRAVHRPSPQIFDAETQRRKEFAKICYPTQHYSPGLGATDLKIQRPKNSVDIHTQEIDVSSEVARAPVVQHALPIGEAIEEFNDHDYPDAAGDRQIAETITSNDLAVPKVPAKTLPGAWPIMNTDAAAANANQGEERLNSFSSYNKETIESRYEPSSSVPHVAPRRLHRHRSLINPETKSKPSFDLSRSHTVKYNSSAARLNGPFSPLFPLVPVPQQFDTASTPEPQHSLAKQPAGPIRNLHRSNSERRPRSLYEPYRMHGAHRSFEPVWEDQLQHQKAVVPNPGAVIVDASNFESGTTEKDIRDMLAEDCRTIIGINTLISCRIVHTEPVVVAKLVIKDKSHADQVIDKYNNKWVGSRPLHFEYAQTGIDARINRIRGALPPTKDQGPKHLRSVPNLHEAIQQGMSKPDFLDFVSQPRPINKEMSNTQVKPSLPPTPLPSQPPLTPGFAPAMRNQVDSCEHQLKSMGYGAMDPALLSRLHVYAAAANGNIDSAIDMIEEDKKANAMDDVEKAIERSREESLSPIMPGEFGQSDDFATELERAIRKSMEDK